VTPPGGELRAHIKAPTGELRDRRHGVARYHRRGCILIRFLGADDLEIMTRQEAEEVKFMACRACQPDQLEG